MAKENELKNSMVDNNVYVLTTISPETTNELIAQLSCWVDKIPLPNLVPCNKSTKSENNEISDDEIRIIGQSFGKIYSPYEITPKNQPILNVYINSNGGKTAVMQSILTLFNIASAKGTIIKTYNLATASSSASMIAISGTRGYRFMSENAYNYIHFGRYAGDTTHTDEIEFVTKDLKNFDKTTRYIYLQNTKLTEKELDKYYNTEGAGRLYAKQCLQKGLCDWVITTDGRFVNNVRDLKSNQR